MAGNRDNFTEATKNKLGKQVNWHCSRQGCVGPTVSATADGNGVITLGRAAHITAAAPGGPRYDARLSPEERRSANNGIWLCGDCANLIDADDAPFTEQTIREWKRNAQKRAWAELVLSRTQPGYGSPFGAEDIAGALSLAADAARTRLDTLRRIATWPHHPIPLDLRLALEDVTHGLQPVSLAAFLEAVDDAALVAAPGMGKTTTMLQIAAEIIERRSAIATVILLAEWAVGGQTLLAYLAGQTGFRDLPQGHIELLARSGRLVLLLDGWNELDDAARRRTRLQINELKRDYPELQFVVSSRHQEYVSERVAQLMMSYLEHPEYGLDAAQTLAHIARAAEPGEEGKPFRSGPDFEPVRARFRKRQGGGFRDMHPFVEPILAAARNVASTGEPRMVERGFNLAAIALGMPYANKRDQIDWFLGLDTPALPKQRLLTCMALAGEIVPLELVTLGIDQLLTEREKNRWMLDDHNGWRLDAWLQLLPFTGNPEAIAPYFDRIDAGYLRASRLHGFIAALGFSPFPASEQVLIDLARRDPDALVDYEWMTAVGKRDTETIGDQLLGLLTEFSDRVRDARRLDMHRQLAALLKRHPGLRGAVHRQYRESPPGPFRNTLEMTIAEDSSEDGVMTLLAVNASEGRHLRATSLPSALQNVLVGQRSSSSFRGMQEMYGLPAGDLRRRLFTVVLAGTPPESALATACLDEIDEIMDRYGTADSDRRHPDITTGKPWPSLG